MCFSFLFFVGGNFYVVLKEMDGGDCNTKVADTTLHPVNVFLLNVLVLVITFLQPRSFTPCPPLSLILYVSLFTWFFVCPCVCVCETKLKRVCLCLASVCMHHGMCVCVSQREVTHETVALLFFHLLQCSGLPWQGSCGYQSLENKACTLLLEGRERETLREQGGRERTRRTEE